MIITITLITKTTLLIHYNKNKKFFLSKTNQRWNLKNLSRGLNPSKPGLNLAPA